LIIIHTFLARHPWRGGVGQSSLASFENHIFPTLGGRETASLKPAELVDVILPIWQENNDTGTRLCQRLQSVLAHAIKIDDVKRFPDRLNIAEGLLNRLPTGLRPPVEHMVAADVHGFRTTFKSWALDHLKHPLDIPAVELSLDHAIGNKVGEVYRDTSLISHRRILNERGSSYLRGVATLVVDNAAA